MKTTLIQQRREAASSIQKTVQEMLGWTEEKYFWHIHETGMQYLYIFCGSNKEFAKYLANKKFFWNWFKNNWFVREECFVEHMQSEPLSFMLSIYESLHDPEILACEIAPPRIVLQSIPNP